MIGVAFLDVSTGEFLISQGSAEYIDKLLQNFSPRKSSLASPGKSIFRIIWRRLHTFHLEDWVFQTDYAHETLTKHFETKTLKDFGVDHLQEGLLPRGRCCIIFPKPNTTNWNTLVACPDCWRCLCLMDRFTIRNLELYLANTSNAVTLLDVIDQTISPMEARLLKRWLAFPLERHRKNHAVTKW